MSRNIIITPESYLILKKKIAYLEKKQKETAERLSLTSGDLSENADFLILDAKNLSLLREIEEEKKYLERVKLVQKSNDKSLIGLGSIVTYQVLSKNLNDKPKKITIEITDEIEANLQGKVSVTSPVGSNLLGKKVGDALEIKTGRSKHQIQILEIK